MKDMSTLALVELACAVLNELDRRDVTRPEATQQIGLQYCDLYRSYGTACDGGTWRPVLYADESVRTAGEQYGTSDLGRLFEMARKTPDPDDSQAKTAAERYAALEANRRANDAAVHRSRVEEFRARTDRDAAWRSANV